MVKRWILKGVYINLNSGNTLNCKNEIGIVGVTYAGVLNIINCDQKSNVPWRVGMWNV